MDFRLIFETLDYQYSKYPNKQCIVHKESGQWITFSCKEILDLVNALCVKLKQKGYGKDDKAYIISRHGCAYWIIVDLALQKIGVTVVPLHANYHDDELNYIHDLIKANLCFAENENFVDYFSDLENKPEIVLFNKSKDFPFIQEWLTETSTNNNSPGIDTIDENDLATIIFTSGSTGVPKGVMLSHKNMVSNVKSIISVNPVPSRYRCASYLPLSHVFERMSIYSYLASGVSIHFISDLTNMTQELQEIHPQIMTSVPRVLERSYEYVQRQMEERPFIKKHIGKWALQKGRSIDLGARFNLFDWLKIKIAQVLVYKRWRKALGGNLKKIIVGAAAMDPHLARLFSAAGIEIREGYGLTETSPAVSFNRFEPGGNRFGTVGIPIPGVEVKIANKNEEGAGEILVRGPNVMLGYYKDPKLTDKVIDSEGWFNTGDIGLFVEKRFLKITDRKKNIFKTSSGRYVYPQRIEKELKRDPFIIYCMILGFQKPYVSGLIVPDFERLKRWCNEQKIHWTSEQYIVLNPKVRHLFSQIIERVNSGLKSHEKIQEFTLLHRDWSISSGELTNTLKLKREEILRIYGKEVEEMYRNKKY